ncbi:hypothetical protein [Sporosarcina sp. P29]|uniref:hypothetical protein n=1 Tax=Sporosarcina sp. P29 TaxID=2048252 RepID=UPI0013046EE0|nr:hypothetical protein [Sporosarcina sp. P29]
MNEEESTNKKLLNTTLTFFGLISIYTLILNPDVGIKEISLMLFFTLVFWLLNKPKLQY